jgi:hypothetical protein
VVDEIVFQVPGLAAVDRALAELPDFIGAGRNELQVAL